MPAPSTRSRTAAATLTVAIALGGLGIGAGTASAAPVPAAAAPQIVHTNWFTDWNTCIWGIGVPTGLALRNPAAARNIAWNVLRSRDRGGLVRAYGNHVVSACERFIRS